MAAPSAPPSPSPSPFPSRPASPSWAARLARGSAWTLAGYAAAQLTRLVGNVLLARLLVPEAFGLMALVALLLQALQMFSDVGLAPAVVRDPRGEEPPFLRTVWTVQILRGALLAAVGVALAPLFARLYGDPRLAGLAAVASLSLAVAGLQSTRLHTAKRRLELKRLAILEWVAQISGLLVILALAWLRRDIWALVWGALVSAAVKVLLSHSMLPGAPDRLGWEPESARALLRFGRWIMLSSVLGFLAASMDRIVTGYLMTPAEFGLFVVAQGFAVLAFEAVMKLGDQVLMPTYAEMARSDPDRLPERAARLRLALVALAWAVGLALSLAGPALVAVLYDQRYQPAGRILAVLALGPPAAALGVTYAQMLLASGRSRAFSAVLAFQAAARLAAVALGYALAGVLGMVWAVAAVGFLEYPVVAAAARAAKFWQPRVDFPVLAAAAALFLLAALTWAA